VLTIEHDDTGKVTGVVYADAESNHHRQRRAPSGVAGNSIREPEGLLLKSASSMFPDGLANSSGLWRQELHAARATPRARSMRPSTSRCISIAVTPHGGHLSRTRRPPSRARLRRRLRLETLAFGRALQWRLSSIPVPGAVLHPEDGAVRPMAGLWIVGRGHAAGTNCGDPASGDQGPAMGCRCRTCISDDHVNDIAMREHAFRQGRAVYEAAGATDVYEVAALSSTHNLGTNRMTPARATGWSTPSAEPRHRQSLRLGRQRLHDGCRREPDPDDRGPGHPPGRLHRGSDGQGRSMRPSRKVRGCCQWVAMKRCERRLGR
jgi:hypothetical protein